MGECLLQDVPRRPVVFNQEDVSHRVAPVHLFAVPGGRTEATAIRAAKPGPAGIEGTPESAAVSRDARGPEPAAHRAPPRVRSEQERVTQDGPNPVPASRLSPRGPMRPLRTPS